jgi:hypothetical protein
MRSLTAWYVVLLALCVGLPYLLGVRPKRARDWRYLSLTIGFLTWLMLGFVFLRSR